MLSKRLSRRCCDPGSIRSKSGLCCGFADMSGYREDAAYVVCGQGCWYMLGTLCEFMANFAIPDSPGLGKSVLGRFWG